MSYSQSSEAALSRTSLILLYTRASPVTTQCSANTLKHSPKSTQYQHTRDCTREVIMTNVLTVTNTSSGTIHNPLGTKNIPQFHAAFSPSAGVHVPSNSVEHERCSLTQLNSTHVAALSHGLKIRKQVTRHSASAPTSEG